MHIIGAKKGQATKPYIMPDNMQSGNEVGIVYGLGEGEILGLVDGGKSIYLDGTPLINDNGGENFGGVSWEMRTGTIDQEHLHGFPAVENETSVNVELRHDRAFVRQIRNTKLSAVVIRLGFGAIFTAKDNGDRVGHTIEYAIDVQTDGGVWREVLATKFSGKASQGYKRSHRIDLPTAKNNWTIRVRRLTANKDSEMVGDRMTIDALTEVIDAKLRYPCTALIGLRFNAESFNNIPKFAAECHGMIIQVPTNYDPVARTYAGLWDGTFKLAYSNNPAWIYYDLCTARRYALGDRLIGHLDKWSLYRVAQYCDEMVDDGRGGREPRYACNVYLQQREDAYKILQNIAGIFHALTYWDGEQIIVDADLPKDVLYTFSRANIIGDFEYSGTANYARHTQIKVAYDDPDNEYKTTYEIVPDLHAIAKYGVKTLDMSAFGCTSQAQAIRLGKWALLSEALETQTVTFSVGLDGYLPHVGSVIAVSDHVLAGRDNGGRVQAIDGNTITLDRAITKPLASGDMLMINGNDGVTETRTITAINGNKITVQTAFERAEVDAVWAMDSTDLQTLKLRVMSIVQSEPAKFTITGVEYNPDKFAAAEIDIRALPKPVSVIPTAVISAPETVTISQSVRVEQGVSITKLSIDWSQVIGAVAYRVEWRKDDSDTWIALPKTASQSIDIDNVYSGNYQARVRAIDAFDNESLATSSQITQITGKVGKPPRPARITATGKLFGMDLTWSFNAGSADTNYTEIQVSPDSRSNIATLGTFAYPTDKHTINGLQGNLTQFYRARIVDKLGNVSDWTDWTSGTTEAQADKVLELLTGQITASQLHQDLSTPIGKIGGIENSLNTAKIDLSALNASMTTAKADITKAKSDLNTAISNITTERNRISAAIADITKAKSDLNTAISNITTERNRITTAIRDITALQTANNAKTAEIANLTQTVNGHTSSIRDLAVTTGELSQRYTQLKTASDNANSEITAIKQTQSGQATQLDTLNSRFDSLSVGGRNLLLNTQNITWWVWRPADKIISNRLELTQPLFNLGMRTPYQAGLDFKDGEVITLSFEYRTDLDNLSYTYLLSRESGNMDGFSPMSINNDGQWHRVTTTAIVKNDRLNCSILIGSTQSAGGASLGKSGSYLEIRNVKLERGTIATDWTPAPEDIDAQFVQTNANINTLQQTVTDADQALSRRIDTLDASYKSADSTLSASIATEQQARTTADTALSQRITALDTAYKSADTQANAKIATLEQSITDKDSAMSRRVDTLQASYNTLNSSKASMASVTAETQARTTADNALSQRIDSLNSDYQGNKSSVASQIKTLSDADKATAQRIDGLASSFDSLSVGGRNLLRDSEFANFMPWISANSAIRQSLYRERTYTQVRISQNITASQAGVCHAAVSHLSFIQAGATYTLSLNAQATPQIVATGLNYVFLMYSDGGGNFRLPTIAINGSLANRPSVTFTAPRTAEQCYLLIAVNGTYDADQWFAFHSVKLERGTIATDWTPAPEDVDSQFVQTNANISTLQQTVTNADQALSRRIDSLSSDYNSNKASVASQLKTLSDKDTATASQISSLQANVTTAQNTANTASGKADTATTKADNAQATANNALSRANTANSAIATEQTARADADNALSQRISQLDSAYKSSDNALSARVATAEQSITTANQAIAQTQQTLTAKIDSLSVGGRNLLRNTATPSYLRWGNRGTLNNTRLDVSSVADDASIGVFTQFANINLDASADYVLSFDVDTDLSVLNYIYLLESNGNVGLNSITNPSGRVSVKFRTPRALQNVRVLVGAFKRAGNTYLDVRHLKLERGTIATDWTPAPEDINVDLSPYATNASLNEFKRTEAQANNALSQRIDSLNTSLGTKANAAALNDLSTKVNQVDSKLTAEASKISTLQTTVNGQTSSIQQHSQSINGLYAQWTLKAESNGIVSGIGLASSNGVSDFAVRANKFYVASPTGTTKTPLFSVLTTATTINGVSVPAGVYLSSAYIQNGSIDIAKINKASIGSLSALSANIGTLTTSDSRGTFTYTGSKIELRDPQGRLLMEMGLL